MYSQRHADHGVSKLLGGDDVEALSLGQLPVRLIALQGRGGGRH